MTRKCFYLDPYFILHVDKKASSEQILQAYRKILRNRHPDGTIDDKIYYGHVKDAFQLLMDANRRNIYDECLLESEIQTTNYELTTNNPVNIEIVAVAVIIFLFYIYQKWNEPEENRRPARVVRMEQRAASEEQRRMQRMQFQQFLEVIQAIEQRIQMEQQSPASNDEIFQRVVPFQYRLENENDERELCTICQDLLEDGQNACHLPRCQHTFHVDCLYPWLRTNAVCPNCKIPLKDT